MRTLLRALAVGAVLISAPRALAAPVLAIDLDPGTPAVESSADLALGGSLTLAITIANVDAAAPLNAFELDLDFDPAILAATAASVGGFLALPNDVAEADLAAPDVNLLYYTLGPGASSGSGVLAFVTFEGVSPGTSALSLSDVILSAPFGVDIPVGGLNAASIRVVPEPESALLGALGLVGLALAGARRRTA